MNRNDDSDSEDEFSSYADGVWTWSEVMGQLDFHKIKKPEIADKDTILVVVNNIKFNDDVGPLELARFAKYFRRRSKARPHIMMLQDVKDFVLFTTPKEILNKRLIQLFHYPQTERYLRALILYMQYFIQCKDKMKERIEELKLKIRTEEAQQLEDVLAENLRELRLLLGREYCLIIMGIGTYAPYHHKGKDKSVRSLSKKDIQFYECFVKLCIQIVYIALNRRDYDEISNEINRVLKTESFGQTVKTSGLSVPSEVLPLEVKLEKMTLNGKVFPERMLLNRKSPLIDELGTQRACTDCRLLHAGQFVIPEPISPRLYFYQRMIAAPEKELHIAEEYLGIIGMNREHFDTALKLIPSLGDNKKSQSHSDSRNTSIRSQPKVLQSAKSIKQRVGANKKGLELLKIPESTPLFMTDKLELVPLPLTPCDKVQRTKWMRHVDRSIRRSRKLSMKAL